MNALTRRSFAKAAGAAGAVRLEAQDVVDRNQAPPERHLLSANLTPAKLAGLLLDKKQWKYFPTWNEHEKWQGLPSDARREAIEAGERQLGAPWPSLPATLFLEFKRNGNRSRFEAVRSARRNRLRELVVAECVEGKGRFLDEITNGIWLISEETFWGVPAHLGAQKAGTGLPDVEEPIVDLFAADTGSLFSWTLYSLGDQLDAASPLTRRRMNIEVRRRILDPCWSRIDFWWMGLDPKQQRAMNNWNPWINSNWLTCALLLEEGERRPAAVHKIISSIDRFLDGYHEDGGCDEGPGYWGHAGGSLFECLELLYSASGGKLEYYGQPLIKEIGRYIYRTHIDKDWYTNFADASARNTISSDLVYRYGKRTGVEEMMAQGGYAAMLERAGRSSTSSIARQLDALFNLEEFLKARRQAPYVRDVFLKGTQVFAARMRTGSPEGFYVAAQGGHNNESHNHNDVGNFIVFLDGEPVLIDVGVETYTAKTFSSQRYEIWTMNSAHHNLPTVNGVMQGAGRRFEARNVACETSDQRAEFALDIDKAYPPEAGIGQWRRTVRLDRNAGAIEVRDDYKLRKADRIEFSLMTTRSLQGAPANGTVRLSGGVRLTYDPGLTVVVDEIKTDDARLRPVWGNVVRRIRLIAPQPKPAGSYVIKVEKA